MSQFVFQGVAIYEVRSSTKVNFQFSPLFYTVADCS